MNPLVASAGKSTSSSSNSIVAVTITTREGGRQDPSTETLIPIQSSGRARNRKQNGIGIGRPGDPMFTLDTNGDHAARGRAHVAFHLKQDPIRDDVSPALGTTTDRMGLMSGTQVRRLTPVECERLQGFPDGYTNVPGASDASRYFVLGNSIAVPILRWLGGRIALVDALREAA